MVNTMDESDLREQLAALYLRLNGFFTSGFIVHAPQVELNDKSQLRKNRTEVDILAVRFPHNGEPERQVEPARFLCVSSEYIDLLICEVKGAKASVQFNDGLWAMPESVCSVLRWIGVFDEHQVSELIEPVSELLKPQEINNHEKYREYVVPENLVANGKVRIRPILFAPDRQPSEKGQTKFIHGQELIDYVWACLRPDEARATCVTRYDFGLWGLYEPLVRLFKDSEHKPTMGDVYGTLRSTTRSDKKSC